MGMPKTIVTEWRSVVRLSPITDQAANCWTEGKVSQRQVNLLHDTTSQTVHEQYRSTTASIVPASLPEIHQAAVCHQPPRTVNAAPSKVLLAQ